MVLKILGAGGGTFYDDVQQLAMQWFTTVQFFKPDASRGSSDESFLVGVRKLQDKRPMGAISPRATASLAGFGKNPAAGDLKTLSTVGGFGLDDWPGQLRAARPVRGGNARGRGGGTHRR